MKVHHQNPSHLLINGKVNVSRMSRRFAISLAVIKYLFLCKRSTSIGNLMAIRIQEWHEFLYHVLLVFLTLLLRNQKDQL
jgi:hypothetical protein